MVISAAVFARSQEQSVWIPQGLQILQESASSKSGFTFDHSMLVLASKLEPNNNNEDLRRVIAGISAISVQNYRFQEPAQYDPEALRSVSDEYRKAGWKQLMNEHDKRLLPGVTDFWVRLENNAISNVAILVVKPNEVSFVTVSGSLSPLDLSHLGGHFGIPKMEGGVVVPSTSPH
jgi:hypothetical protein